jgi:small subunit ribosomal protein S1
MEELNKQEKEISFEEAFESSMVTLRNGDVVKGKVIGYNNAEVFIDLGYKSDGIIPIDEYTDDPDFKAEENIKIGEEIEVFVVRVNDGEGNVLLSKKRVDSMRGLDYLWQAYENKTPVQGKVVEVTNGGVIAGVNGVKVFIPASQVSDRYVKDLSEWNAIFKRFYRGKNAKATDGAGLGLYLASLIFEKQGGYILVDSKPGQYTTFSMFLQNCKK